MLPLDAHISAPIEISVFSAVGSDQVQIAPAIASGVNLLGSATVQFDVLVSDVRLVARIRRVVSVDFYVPNRNGTSYSELLGVADLTGPWWNNCSQLATYQDLGIDLSDVLSGVSETVNVSAPFATVPISFSECGRIGAIIEGIELTPHGGADLIVSLGGCIG